MNESIAYEPIPLFTFRVNGNTDQFHARHPLFRSLISPNQSPIAGHLRLTSFHKKI